MNTVRASIDIGSNSTLLLVMDTKSKEILDERSTITSLGKDLDKNGVFLESTMNATYEALKEYARACATYGVQAENIIISATEASRVAGNAKEFFTKVQNELGMTIQTISGEGEAYYTALGIAKMLKGFSGSNAIIMDVGGASTELIDVSLDSFKINSSVSLPVGSVRTTDWIEEGSVDDRFENAFLNVDFKSYENKNVICVAGTMTTLALMMCEEKEFSAEVINEYNSNLNEYRDFVKIMSQKDVSQLEKEAPHLGKRAFSIKGGAKCALNVLKRINAKDLFFSTYGLRYGTLLNGGIDADYLV